MEWGDKTGHGGNRPEVTSRVGEKRRAALTGQPGAAVPTSIYCPASVRLVLLGSERRRGKKLPPIRRRGSGFRLRRARPRQRRPWQCGGRQRNRVRRRAGPVLRGSSDRLRVLPP